MVQENATEYRACSGVWGTRITSSGTCRLGMHGCIGIGDVLFYMYNHFTETETMNRDELLEQLDFYRKLVEEQGNIIESLRSSIDEMRKNHKESQSYIKNLLKQIAELSEKLDKVLSTIGNLEKKLSDYDSRNDLNNQRLLGSRSKI